MANIFVPKLFTLVKQGISKQQIIADMMAGVIVGIVALPLAIAFAVASGVSPERGIITAVIAGFIISFLGGSRVQIGGPTGAFIIILYAILEQYGIDGLLISTILAGIIL
ncbi:MAG: SulP family inorganic anion transporter [Sulfurimonas sp.]